MKKSFFKQGVQHAIREGFGQGLLEIGSDKQVYALSADLTESNKMDLFRKKYSSRFVELGVAEQNMIGVAAGLACLGKIPYTASFAVFSPGRSWDQIRVSACYNNLPVKIYGGHAGLSVGEDGATHQALEDIAITRVLPNMTVIVPCDAEEMRRAVHASKDIKGPVYLRGSRPKTTVITKASTPFKVGVANILQEGSDITIIACGLMVERALQTADLLKKEGISCEVINCHTIKPLDKTTITSSAKKTGFVVTIEEHQIIGGLGSAIAECLSEKQPTKLLRLGINDSFGESGTYEELFEKYELTPKHFAQKIRRFVKK